MTVTADITPREIERIWDAHGLGSVRLVDIPRRGGVNSCFIINGELVVRFQLRDTERPRFRGEKAACDNLTGTGLPVPKAVILDESRSIVPYDFLITTRLPGEPVIDCWPRLTPDERKQTSFEAGLFQAQMHQITLDTFGDMHDHRGGKFGTWAAYLADYFERHVQMATDRAILDEATIFRLRRVFSRQRTMFESVRCPSMLHSDYHWENILQEDGRVTGIVDFEWALAGDPSFDCRTDENLEGMCPGSVEPLYAGYRSVRRLPPDHEARTYFYALLLNLESVAGWHDDPLPEWYQTERRNLFSRLDLLERCD